MNTDVTEDQRIGPEILKQQAELYRRIRNTLRWLLGGLDGFSDAERLPHAELPELERWVLHRLAELDARVRGAVATHDWTGVVPEIHGFCATDLSAFYFDIRKDALYCDAAGQPEAPRRARTVLDLLHRHLCAWLAPVLVFTAEEAWLARFGGEEESIHLHDFPAVPAEWRDEALAEKWARVREAARLRHAASWRRPRAPATIGSSLQADDRPCTRRQRPTLLLLEPRPGQRSASSSEVDVAPGPRPNGASRRRRPVRARARRQMRPLLAGAAGGGPERRAPGALPPLRSGGGGPGTDPGRRMTLRIGLAVAALLLAADQASKWWILEVLRLPELRHVPLLALGPFGLDLSMVWNRGVTFGLLSGDGPWNHLILAVLAAGIAAVPAALAGAGGNPDGRGGARRGDRRRGRQRDGPAALRGGGGFRGRPCLGLALVRVQHRRRRHRVRRGGAGRRRLVPPRPRG